MLHLNGLWSFLRGEAGLEVALGLKPSHGQRAARTTAILAERDQLLQEAAAEFFAEAGPTEQARLLHVRWTRYAAAGWPRERTLEAAPEARRGTLEGQFWRIMKLRAAVLSDRRIRAVLAASSGFLWPEEEANFGGKEEDQPRMVSMAMARRTEREQA